MKVFHFSWMETVKKSVTQKVKWSDEEQRIFLEQFKLRGLLFKAYENLGRRTPV